MKLTDKKPGFAMRVVPILVMALLTSLYLLHHDLAVHSGLQIGTSICQINEVFDCEAVAKSEYSQIFGLPVAMFGALFYSLLLFLLFCLRRPEDAEKTRSSVLFWSGLSLIPSIYLAQASFFVIGKICLFCSFLYVLNFFLFILTYILGRAEGSFLKRLWQGAITLLSFITFRRGPSFPFAFIGLALFYFFGQIVYITHILEPRYMALYDVRALEELEQHWRNAPIRGGIEGVVSINGTVQVGSKDARFTLVEFSDHECPLCQKMAPIVEEIISEAGPDLRVIFLSYPLDSSCNPYMEREMHPYACKLASLIICAAFEDQERAHKLHDAIMAEGIGSEESYQRFIESEGLNEETCLGREDVRQSLLAQINAGNDAEITGTPSFFLNGKQVVIREMRQLKPFILNMMGRE